MQGLHLTADLYDCRDAQPLMRDAVALARLCEAEAGAAGLTVVGRQFHAFAPADQPAGGVTGMLLLAESHLAVHTWPEQLSVTLDVYVCNFRSDNRRKAEALADALVAAFAPGRALRQRLWRGGVLPTDLPEASGGARQPR